MYACLQLKVQIQSLSVAFPNFLAPPTLHNNWFYTFKTMWTGHSKYIPKDSCLQDSWPQ